MDDADEMTALPEDHYISMLAIGLGRDDGLVVGSAPVRPELFARGTTWIRTGLLLTMVDLVAGHAPDGPIAPTIDLRLQVLAPPPATGWIHLSCRPLRVGSRLVVAETELRAEDAVAPFARAVSTFMNVSLGGGAAQGPRPLLPMDAPSFDDFLRPRVRDACTLELDPVPRLANGQVGTVQGGAQALLAELAAEHALARGGTRLVATDIDIRYLSRLTVGPLAATVEHVPTADGTCVARVRLSDAGDGDRLVSFAALTLANAG